MLKSRKIGLVKVLSDRINTWGNARQGHQVLDVVTWFRKGVSYLPDHPGDGDENYDEVHDCEFLVFCMMLWWVLIWWVLMPIETFATLLYNRHEPPPAPELQHKSRCGLDASP